MARSSKGHVNRCRTTNGKSVTERRIREMQAMNKRAKITTYNIYVEVQAHFEVYVPRRGRKPKQDYTVDA